MKKTAFTLLELLIVIAMIAIVVGIAMTIFKGSSESQSTTNGSVTTGSSGETATVHRWSPNIAQRQITGVAHVHRPILWADAVDQGTLRRTGVQALSSRLAQFRSAHPEFIVQATTPNATPIEKPFEREYLEVEVIYNLVPRQTQASSSTVVPPVVSSGTLTIAIREGYGVFTENADPFFADLIGKRVNRTVKLVPFKTPKQCIMAVKTGQANLALGLISATPERTEHVNFSKPYFKTGLVLATLNPGAWQKKRVSFTVLPSTTQIFYGRGTTAETFKDSIVRSLKYREFLNSQAAYEAAKENGDSVLLLADEAIVSLWPEAMMLEVSGDTLLQSENYCVAVNKSDQTLLNEVNNVIREQQVEDVYNGFAGR